MIRAAAMVALLLLLGFLAGKWAFAQGWGGAVAYVFVIHVAPLVVGVALPRRPVLPALIFNLSAFAAIVWCNISFDLDHGISLARELEKAWLGALAVLLWTAAAALLAIPASWLIRPRASN